jgi:two-component system response regulator NreC
MVRILIADDSALMRDCLRETIEGHPDWEICGEASDGLQAVSRTAELNPDLVILDLAMPHLSGIQAAKTIRIAAPKLPLLLFTQHLLDSFLVEEARGVGFNGVISKSADHLLFGAIEALLGGEDFFAGNERTVREEIANEPKLEVREGPSAGASTDEPS